VPILGLSSEVQGSHEYLKEKLPVPDNLFQDFGSLEKVPDKSIVLQYDEK
jgi:hypothetical protein